MKPEKILNIDSEYKLPSALEHLRKQQSKAVEAWGKIYTQLAVDRDNVERAEQDDKFAMREAARQGKKDPRDSEALNKLKRAAEYTAILEDEASKKANLAGIEFRIALRENKSLILEHAANEFEKALNEFVNLNESIRTQYVAAQNSYKRAAMNAKQIVAITTEETDLVQLIGLTDGRLELPKFERYGQRAVSRIRGNVPSIEEHD